MDENIDLGRFIALLLPLILVELGLLVSALHDLVRRRRVKGGNKWLWGAIILFVSLVGPILYLVLGREED